MAIDKIQSESINLADNFAFTGTVTGAGGTNTPAFLATKSSNQTIQNNSDVKVVVDTEVYDTDSAYDASNSKFVVPSGKAGKYCFYGQLRLEVNTDDTLFVGYIYFFKNGSLLSQTRTDFGSNGLRHFTPVNMLVTDLAVGDYVELYGAINSSATNSYSASDTRFGGFKIIE